jgi:hypothetical protein
MIPSYGSIFNLGHRALLDLFSGPVVVQEKVDGSQISFGRRDSELRIRSKGQPINVDAPDKMFAPGVEAIKAVAHQLMEGYTYRGEYLQKPKHNALTYSRIPSNHIVLFDVDAGDQAYTPHYVIVEEAARLGFDAVPELFTGIVADHDFLRNLLQTESFLGGCKIEGVVIKNYWRFGQDKKILMGKLVSEAFKELHTMEWGAANPKGGDILQQLTDMVRTERRWEKAVEHLRDAGLLEGTPRDIGKLVVEVPNDIEREAQHEIIARLWNWAWPTIRRNAVKGLAEWYKDRLASDQPMAEVCNIDSDGFSVEEAA